MELTLDIKSMKNVFIENIESGKEIVCGSKEDKHRLDQLGIPCSDVQRTSAMRRSTLSLEQAKKQLNL